MEIQRDIFIAAIGTCYACERCECSKPKAKKLYPENGCTDWTTPEAEATAEAIEPLENKE